MPYKENDNSHKIQKEYEVSNIHEISVDWNGYNFLIIYGCHVNGWFIAIPNWNVCVEAGSPLSVQYNSDKIYEKIRLIDSDLKDANIGLAKAIKEHWESLDV